MKTKLQKQKKSTLKKWLPAIILALFIHLILVAFIFYSYQHKTETKPKDAIVITPVTPIKPVQEISIIETQVISPNALKDEETGNTSKKSVNTATNTTKPLSNQQNKQTKNHNNNLPSITKPNQANQVSPNTGTQKTKTQINHSSSEKINTLQENSIEQTQTIHTKKNSGSASGGNTVGLIKGVDIPTNEYQDPTSVLQGNYKKVNELKAKMDAIHKEEKTAYEKISDGAIAIKEFNKQNIEQELTNKKENASQ
ncbi:MAG: hypothetical protein CSA42_02825 [Gammaproteobacteria bacterium]|nr:MAG: hypothetical protein CSA42_02825 [Gammaproteobacteria bacterium]